jgi:hypothetical protein
MQEQTWKSMNCALRHAYFYEQITKRWREAETRHNSSRLPYAVLAAEAADVIEELLRLEEQPNG